MRRSRTPWRTVRTAAALALAAGVLALPGGGPAAAGPGFEPGDCTASGGQPDDGTTVPWPRERLDFARVQRLATGAGVTVAVVDSGVDPTHVQVQGIDLRDPRNVLPGYQPTDVRDCDDKGHGTGVTSIIAAQPVEGVGFRGLAPDVTIMPIKEDDPDGPDGTPATVAAAIRAALDSPLGVDVINLSLTLPYDDEDLRAAVEEAGRRDVVVVAAAGNTGADGNAPQYPADYADDGPEFAHVIAVAATGADGTVISGSTRADYVGVAAPGEGFAMPTAATPEGYVVNAGTSFAAPFVSATAALLLERFPDMSAAEVVTRIKATADPPGVAVPGPAYGYGMVNPYVALTAVRDDARLGLEREPLPAVAAPDLPEPPDRTLQNIAYAVAAGMLGIAALAAVGSAALRRTRAERAGERG